MLDGSPTFATIADQTVLADAPTWLALTAPAAAAGPITYSVSVSNPSVLQASVPAGNKSLKMDVSGYGTMTFELLDNLVPNTTEHIETLVNNGEFDTNASFYRIAWSGTTPFVIQGGPSQTTSSLGAMSDEFNPDLQFTTAGLLAMAKSTDDTGDSQIFVTAGPERFLDFQHSIFGVLTSGDSVRQAIQNSTTSGDGPPPSTISISNTQIITDTTNAALELKAPLGASGASDVTVTATDTSTGQTYQQTFHVTVTADTARPAPYLNPIAAVSGAAGQPITVQLTATDVQNNPVYFDATKPAGETTAYTINVDHATGQVTLTPPAGFTGTFHVQMSVKDTGTSTTADPTDTQDVPVTVATAVNDTATVAENAAATTINVLANDTGSSLTVTAVGRPTAGGTVTIGSGGQNVLYTPAANFQGTDTFSYTVTDSQSKTSTATVSVTVGSTTPTTPTAGAISGFAYFDVNNSGVFDSTELPIGGVTIALTGTKASDSSAVNMTTKTADDGSYSFVGLEAGSYTLAETQPAFVIDGKTTAGSLGGTATSNKIVVTLTANAISTGNNFGEVGRDPSTISASDFYSSVAENLAFAAFDSSGNELWHALSGAVWQGYSNGDFAEPTSSQLTVQATSALNGQVATTLSTTSPAVAVLGQSGGNTLYRLVKPPAALGFTSTTTPTNQIPTATSDSYSTAAGTALTISAPGVLTNDTDPQGDSLTATIATQPAHGTVTLASDGSFTYTPTSGFSGSDSFTYTASDGTKTTSPATVTITVNHVNQAPTAAADSYNVTQDTAFTSNPPGVLTNDADPDGDTLSASVVTPPANGTLSLNTDGSFTYTPNSGFAGSDTFTYRASDGTLTSDAVVTLLVSAPNHAPVAAADSYTMAQDATLTVPAERGVLANDTDIDNNTLHAILVQQPANGSATLNDDGSFTYVPTAGFSGTDTFTYQASDGTDTSAETTVTITIDPASGESSSSSALANDAALMALLRGA